MTSEQLISHFDRISEAPRAIPRLRRFILDLAVRGRLVDQDPRDEPAAELLSRIQLEKSRQGHKVKHEKPHAKQVPFALRPGWQAARISEILISLQTGPFGSSLHRSDYQSDGIPVINPASIKNGHLIPIKGMAIGPATLDRLASFKLCEGDVVMARRGEMGRCAVVTANEHGWLCGTGSLILRFPRNIFAPYLVTLLGSPLIRDYLNGSAVGTTMQNLNQSILLNLVIGLPPFAEQHRIVEQVDELMALCDRLEAAQAKREGRRDTLITASLHHLTDGADPAAFREHAKFYFNHLPRLTVRKDHIDQLRKVILRLAVRGKITLQNADDEPASELLERVQLRVSAMTRKEQKRLHPINSADVEAVPFALPSGWAWATFPHLGLFGRGKSKHRPRNDPSLFEGGTHLFVQTGDVARSNGIIKTYTNKYNDRGLAQSRKWPSGTLCITIAANIADSGILDFAACFPDSVVGFIPAEEFPNAKYFEYFLRTAKADLLAFAPATAQKNINLEILSSVLIPLPPLAELNRIVQKVDQLMAICDQLEAQLTIAEKESHQLLEATLVDALASINSHSISEGDKCQLAC